MHIGLGTDFIFVHFRLFAVFDFGLGPTMLLSPSHVLVLTLYPGKDPGHEASPMLQLCDRDTVNLKLTLSLIIFLQEKKLKCG